MVPWNDWKMREDEIVPDSLRQSIFLDKHHSYADNERFPRLHYPHLWHNFRSVCDVLRRTVSMLHDLKHILHHRNDNLAGQWSKAKSTSNRYILFWYLAQSLFDTVLLELKSEKQGFYSVHTLKLYPNVTGSDEFLSLRKDFKLSTNKYVSSSALTNHS